jgi:secretion/DNA translocation related TadE-like protein
VLAVVLIGVLMAAAVLVSVLGGVVADQRRVESAADLGALAGASAVQDGRSGCVAARAVIRRNGADLRACGVVDQVVTVTATRRTAPLLGRTLTVASRARAGPARAGELPALR